MLFKAARLGWEGQFDKACRLVPQLWEGLHFESDRARAGGEAALFLALCGHRAESITIVRQVLELTANLKLNGPFRVRSMAIANVLCAIAEAINNRFGHACRVVERIAITGDPVIDTVVQVANGIMRFIRLRLPRDYDNLANDLDILISLGYADLAKLISPVCSTLLDRSEAMAEQNPLTPAEIGILKLLEEGLIPKQIAFRTNRSVYTIRAHIANAIAKLECHGRLEAIREARERGLLMGPINPARRPNHF